MVFDKTGTLTQGRCSVRSVVLLQDRSNADSPSTVASLPASLWNETRTMALLAAVEAGSEHPLARAMVQHATGVLAASMTPKSAPPKLVGPQPMPAEGVGLPAGILGPVGELEAVPGRGLRCKWTESEAMRPLPSHPGGGKGKASGTVRSSSLPAKVVVGNLQWMSDNDVVLPERALGAVEALELQGCTAVVAAVAGIAIAVIGISDAVSRCFVVQCACYGSM